MMNMPQEQDAGSVIRDIEAAVERLEDALQDNRLDGLIADADRLVEAQRRLQNCMFRLSLGIPSP